MAWRLFENYFRKTSYAWDSHANAFVYFFPLLQLVTSFRQCLALKRYGNFTSVVYWLHAWQMPFLCESGIWFGIAVTCVNLWLQARTAPAIYNGLFIRSLWRSWIRNVVCFNIFLTLTFHDMACIGAGKHVRLQPTHIFVSPGAWITHTARITHLYMCHSVHFMMMEWSIFFFADYIFEAESKI